MRCTRRVRVVRPRQGNERERTVPKIRSGPMFGTRAVGAGNPEAMPDPFALNSTSTGHKFRMPTIHSEPMMHSGPRRLRGPVNSKRLDSCRPAKTHDHLPVVGAPALRYFEKNSAVLTTERTRFEIFRQPWPSSGKRTYSTGTPRVFRVSTICSASTTLRLCRWLRAGSSWQL